MSSWYDKRHPENQGSLPTSVYMIQQIAGIKNSNSVFVDVCPHDHHVYMPGDTRQVCPDPDCAEPRTSKRRILLFNVKGRLKRMLANPKLAPLFHYPENRTPGDGDVWDHELMQFRKKETGDKYVLELGYSSDSCVFQTWKKRAFTPNVCQMLNWPPGLRTCFGGMLLFAVFPPKVHVYICLYIVYLYHISKSYIYTYIYATHYIYTENIISTHIQ